MNMDRSDSIISRNDVISIVYSIILDHFQSLDSNVKMENEEKMVKKIVWKENRK